MKKVLITLFLLPLAFLACRTVKDAAPVVPEVPLDCKNSQANYAGVQNIMTLNCNRCHSYGNTSGGYDFSNKEDVKRAGANGALLGSIKHLSGFSRMPFHSAKLSQGIIDEVECWIKNGMKD